MAAATQERMIRLWASPQGALKSALAGIQDPPLFAVRPGTQVPADVATAGKTSVVWEGGKPVVSFPIPGVPGATATATLDAKFMAERVVVRSMERTPPSSSTATIGTGTIRSTRPRRLSPAG